MSPETRREFAEAIRTLSGRVDDMERRLDAVYSRTGTGKSCSAGPKLAEETHAEQTRARAS